MSEKMYSKQEIEEYLEWREKTLLESKTAVILSIEEWEKSKIHKIWKPEMYEEYYHINSFLEYRKTNNTNHKDDIDLFEKNNCFKTEEQAKKIPIRLFLAMWKFKLDNDYVELKGTVWRINDADKYVYSFELKHSYSSVLPTFSSKEKAEACLEWLKEEGLL